MASHVWSAASDAALRLQGDLQQSFRMPLIAHARIKSFAIPKDAISKGRKAHSPANRAFDTGLRDVTSTTNRIYGKSGFNVFD